MRRLGGTASTIVMVAVFMGVNSPAACAQDPIHKLGRGVSNILTCWLEVAKNFHEGMQEDNPLAGATWGIVKGLGLGATRLVVGAYETVSFPLPYPKEYASPYAGMELPDYPWD